jgi:hypothetical protein
VALGAAFGAQFDEMQASLALVGAELQAFHQFAEAGRQARPVGPEREVGRVIEGRRFWIDQRAFEGACDGASIEE